MYPPKTAGFLELLMNALSLPRSRRSHAVRRRGSLPRRREAVLAASPADGAAVKEMYFETARLTRWTR